MTDCEWINASERLPEKPGNYLVYVKDATYESEEKEKEAEDLGILHYDCSYVDTAYYDKNGCLWRAGQTSDDCYCAIIDFINVDPEYMTSFYISHWAEMPKGPEV